MHYRQSELYHHGILGQKWGVRRYQNADGTLTSAGKKRYSNSSTETKDNSKAKKVTAATVLIGTVAAAAVLYSKNPEAVNAVISKIGEKSVKAVEKTANKGKEHVVKAAKQVVTGTKEGIKEGLKEAPKKVVKTVMSGATLVATKKLLDEAIGKDESAKIFQAANNKKVSSFWKTQQEDRDE